jgi:hypothetical protein
MFELTCQQKKFLKYAVMCLVVTAASANYNIEPQKAVQIGMIASIAFAVLDIYSPNQLR